jgi:hypothetical protein
MAVLKMRTVAALGSFRDAVSTSAIVDAHGRTLTWKRPIGVRFSDAFDVYPWTLGRDYNDHLYASTPAIGGIHDAKQLRAQCAPAIGERRLGANNQDDVLLRAILNRWELRFVAGVETIEDRRLFRSLEMARAASKMPGGSDATLYDDGRAVTLWVSAFEILAHDRRVDLARLLALLGRVAWEREKLKSLDRVVTYRNTPISTNIAGIVYEAMYRARNAFLHGEPVTREIFMLPKCRQNVINFAAPLYRLALTAYLDLKFVREKPDSLRDPSGFGEFLSARMAYAKPQRLSEDAVIVADADPGL